MRILIMGSSTGVIVNRAMAASKEVLADVRARGIAVTNYEGIDEAAHGELIGLAQTIERP